MFFLQRNKNTSLNYYDFPNFSALCYFTEESRRVCVAKDDDDEMRMYSRPFKD